MDKNVILAHPGAFSFKVLLEAVLDRIVTTEELQRSGELDSFTIGVLQRAEERMKDFPATRKGRDEFLRIYYDEYVHAVIRRSLLRATRQVAARIREMAGVEFDPDIHLTQEEERELRLIILSNDVSSAGNEATQFIIEKTMGGFNESVRREETSYVAFSIRRNILREECDEYMVQPDLEQDVIIKSACERISSNSRIRRHVYKTDAPPKKKFEPDLEEYHSLPFSLMSGIKRILGTDRKVYASLYTPKEVKALQRFRLQVHLYNLKQAFEVARKAKELDAEARLMDTNPLAMNLKKGTRVTVSLDLNPEEATAERTSATIIWNGEPVSAQFFVKPRVPAGSDLSGEVTVSVNGVAVGTLTFLTRVGRRAGELPAEVNVHRFRKVFISYAHEDEATARAMASAYRAQGTAYFFDHHSLESGAVFNEEIRKNIEESDLFLLLWSQHAARSEYVGKEYRHALKFAYPQKPREVATLTFRPHFVEPVADPPADLRGIYNFSSDLLSNRPAQG